MRKSDLLKTLVLKVYTVRLQVSFLGAPTHADIIDFQSSCCKLKIRDLGAKLWVAFLLFFS